jgi:DnaJ-class molecular chaperone
MFMPNSPTATSLNYCLTCGGTGARGGRLSMGKVCRDCEGTGWRCVETEMGSTTHVDDFKSITIPACFYRNIKVYVD